MRVKVWRDGPSCRAAVSSLRSQQLSWGSAFNFDPGKGSYSTVSFRRCGNFVSTSGLLLSWQVGVYTSIFFGLPVRGSAKVKVQSSVSTSRMEVFVVLLLYSIALVVWGSAARWNPLYSKNKCCCNQLYFAENEDWVKCQLVVAICPQDHMTGLL